MEQSGITVTVGLDFERRELIKHYDVVYHYADANFYVIKEPDKLIKYKLSLVYQVTEKLD